MKKTKLPPIALGTWSWGAVMAGADFLIDGGATASFFYGPLRPDKQA